MKILLAFFLLLTSAGAFATHAVKLKIIHWNDFHAQNMPVIRKDSTGERYSVGGFAYFKAVIDSLKHVAASSEEAYLLLDAGDNFQGTAISSFTRGASQITLMNIIHPDAVTIGNHEFDYGWQNIDSLIRNKAIFNVVDANITQSNGTRLAPPYLIKEARNIKVAIIGLTTDDLPNLTLPDKIKGLKVISCEDALKKYLPLVKKEKPDLIIVLSHIGVDEDHELAKKFPQVNIFVGGHSHTAIFTPIKENHSVIVQAGSKGQYVGELELNVDTDGDSLLSYSGKLIETKNSHYTPDPSIVQQIDIMEAPVNAKLGETIGILKKDWQANAKRGKSGNLASFEAMAFREELNTDLGIINYGGIRKSLLAGPITMKDIYEINPFGNEMVIVRVKGSEIKTALEYKFDGKGNELFEVSGITCTVDTNAKSGGRISDIRINGKKIDTKKSYSISTNNFVASHLHSMLGLSDKTFKIKQTGITDYDLLVDAVRKQKEISGESEEWVSFVK